jgi:TRAP-type mannitol/chloroaromatic compound transport system permease small subunit
MRALLRISRAIDAMTEWIGSQLPWLVTILVAIGFINVVARYVGRFFNTRLTSNAVIEIQWYLFTILFFFGFAYILKHNLNVRVDFLYSSFTPRQQALVDLIGHTCFFLAFCVLGLFVTYQPVIKSWGLLPNGTWGTWEMSPDPDGLPRAPIKSMIIIAFVMLLLQTFSEIVKNVGILTGAVTSDVIEHHAGHEGLAEAE